MNVWRIREVARFVKEIVVPLNKNHVDCKTDRFEAVGSTWLRIISRVRTAIEAHDGYIHIPKLEAIEV